MAETQSDYEHGAMDASTQASDYRWFMTFSKWVSLHLAVLILMLVLWFCVGAGFWGGLIPGLILFVLGVMFLRAKPAQPH